MIPGTDGALSVVSEIPLRIDIAVEGDGRDPEFAAQFRDRRVSMCHGRLDRADLGLCQGGLPSALAAARPGHPRPGYGPLADELALELRKRGENAEGQPTSEYWR